MVGIAVAMLPSAYTAATRTVVQEHIVFFAQTRRYIDWSEPSRRYIVVETSCALASDSLLYFLFGLRSANIKAGVLQRRIKTVNFIGYNIYFNSLVVLL